ncbi:MAG: AAA family ATPase [Nanoarchaeota archaeon]|nr:AAA family ATPase [Nanoarchaeota archaeon]
MIISITGDQGSGKSTVGKLLAKKLNFNYYYTGGYMRKMAENYDMTFEEFAKYAITHKEIDLELDEWQSQIGKKEDNLIMDGHIAWHFIPSSIKVFLKCNEEIAAKRIFNDKSSNRKKETKVANINEKKEQIRMRRGSEKIRYNRFYNIEIYDMDNYNIIIDTSNMSADETVERIVKLLKNSKYL